jgi:glycosyltransferase involved in cell wall biosynthesis
VRRWYLDTFGADPDTLVTLHNGVGWPALETDVRANTRRQLGVTNDTVVATMLSVMRPGKGHAQLLAAAKELAPDLDIRIVLAGDGPLRGYLERAAGGANAEKVMFAGWRSDVAELLTASDLIVHPSLSEALPTALIQGLAASLPAVASDVGGIPEIVTPDTGILLRPGDAGALAEAITRLANDPKRRQAMGRAARARFDEEFDSHVWVQRLRCRYLQVLGK